MSEHRGKHLLSQRRERTEASCAMRHHRPTYETPQVDLIQRLLQTYKLNNSEWDGELKTMSICESKKIWRDELN